MSASSFIFMASVFVCLSAVSQHYESLCGRVLVGDCRLASVVLDFTSRFTLSVV